MATRSYHRTELGGGNVNVTFAGLRPPAASAGNMRTSFPYIHRLAANHNSFVEDLMFSGLKELIIENVAMYPLYK